MLFEDIHPFVRYSRTLEFTKDRIFAEYIPCDCRVFYADAGCGSIKVGEKIFCMKKGSVIIINSAVPYRFISSDVRYLAVNFDYTQNHKDVNIPVPPINSPGTSGLSIIENVNFTDVPELNVYLYAENMFSLKNILLKIENEYSKKLPFYEINTSALLTTALVTAVKTSRSAPASKYGIEDIAAYIQEHYSESITNSQLADIFHFHPNYINDLFKKNLGQSLHKYIIGVRISNAITMLEEGEKSIDEIARETGFYDNSYFSRYFKKVTGVSPKAYK